MARFGQSWVEGGGSGIGFSVPQIPLGRLRALDRMVDPLYANRFVPPCLPAPAVLGEPGDLGSEVVNQTASSHRDVILLGNAGAEAGVTN